MTDAPTPPDDGYFVAARPSTPPASGAPARGTDGSSASGPPVLRLGVVLGLVAALALGGFGLLSLLTGGGPSLRAVAGAAPATDPRPVAPYDGPGSFRIWVTNDDGSPVRWDPCTPIAWVMLQDGAPVSALADTQAAFARITEVTGLEFTFEGFTDERPARDRQPYQPERWGDRWAPVLVAWARPGTGGLDLTTNDRAVTVPVSVDVGRGGVFVTGQVVFNAERRLEPGFITRQAHWGGTILHELGHLAGLDHVDDANELMYPRPGLGPPVFGPGDVAGLQRLGSDLGCLERPEAQHVEVDFAE